MPACSRSPCCPSAELSVAPATPGTVGSPLRSAAARCSALYYDWTDDQLYRYDGWSWRETEFVFPAPRAVTQ